jgi:hypothetical protein
LTSRTPPELKWLLVERATLVGDIVQLERRRALLDADIAGLHRTIQALDTSMRILESRLEPGAAGIRFRHLPGYGRRGALKDFIVKTLQDVEVGLSTREVGQRVATAFALEFVSRSEFSAFLENTIRPGLKDLRRAGKVESRPKAKGGELLWRGKCGIPTLSELALLTGATLVSSHNGEIDDNQDAPGYQVAHQRNRHVEG